MNDNVIQPMADALMTLFLTVLKARNATLHEEALMAVGALAACMSRALLLLLLLNS